jgi:hypothetical protein
MLEGKGSREEPVRPGSQHEQFLELCALAASGSLKEGEGKNLREHLVSCSECREAIREFKVVVDGMIPQMMPELTGITALDDPSFSQEKAEASFQKRLVDEKEREQKEVKASSSPTPLVVRRADSFRQYLHRYEIWIPLVASAVLCATFGILSYRTGKNRGVEWARLEEKNRPAVEAVLANAPAPANADLRNGELAERDAAIAELRRQIALKTAEIVKLMALQSGQQLILQATETEKRQLIEERERIAQQSAAGQEAVQAMRAKLENLERKRSEDAIHAASLETRVAELSRAVADRDRSTNELQELLAKDRDIRELMAARNLVITEVYDVTRTGKTEKAFGRVFYTKGKSLVFYAYDLNDQPGLHEASTYQAWGSRGSDQAQAFNLGMFYEDNVAKKQWVVKFNDKKKLDQIDTVFVTVEPHGGSERPTGKPLLYAYLKVAPNHP